MLSPMEIVDQETGIARLIPYDSMTVSFHRNEQTNQVEITINYGQESLENTFLRFNVSPNNTNIPSIGALPAHNNLHLKLSSDKSGVLLLNYTPELYDFQALIQSVSTAIGFLALAMVLLGLCFPVGKLIILEALAVVQISFFSVLQFDKIPPTLIGFKGLIISNGYNDPNILSSSANQLKDANVYRLMGLNDEILSNYNISLAVMFVLPLFVGLLGYTISTLLKKTQAKKYSG